MSKKRIKKMKPFKVGMSRTVVVLAAVALTAGCSSTSDYSKNNPPAPIVTTGMSTENLAAGGMGSGVEQSQGSGQSQASAQTGAAEQGQSSNLVIPLQEE